MNTTIGYGTWYNHTESLTVEDSVADYASGADSDWREAMEASGAFKRIAAAYREAVNEALPSGVSLAGNEFYGPFYEADRDFDGYRLDEDGALDIAAIIAEINLADIVDRYDVPALVEDAEKATRAAERAQIAADAEHQARAEAVAKVVDAVGGNQSAAAELLGIHPSRVSRMLTKIGRTYWVTLIAGVVGDDFGAIFGRPAYDLADPDRPQIQNLLESPYIREFLAAYPTGPECPERVVYLLLGDAEVPADYPLPSVIASVRA